MANEKKSAGKTKKGSGVLRPTANTAASATAPKPSRAAKPPVASTLSPAGDAPQGTVHGKVVDGDGNGLAATITLVSQLLRDRTSLANTKTDGQGQYSLTYARPAPLNLVVQASLPGIKDPFESAVAFAAPVDVEIDLTTAPDGVVRSLSTYATLQAGVQAQLATTPFESLLEDKNHHDLGFLANTLGVPFANVAELYIAHRLAAKNKLSDPTLFGIFSQNIPATLGATLADLPDTGIDDAFLAQVLAGVLSHSHDMLAGALTAAITANILPASYASKQDAELTQLDALRIQGVGSSPYLNGTASLNDLLTAGKVDPVTHTAFAQAYSASGGNLAATWDTLHQNPNLTQAQLTALDNTLQASELLGGNLPLVTDALTRLSQGTLASPRDLALLGQADWVTRIQQLDPKAQSIPPLDANETAAHRITRFAGALADNLASRYPTTAFLGGLSRAPNSSFSAKAELVSILTAHPDLDLRQTSLDSYLAKNALKLSTAALADLKSAQRLLRLAPQYAGVDALKAGGYSSAQAVYFAGRASFITQMTPVLGSADIASTVWARAQTTYVTALATFGRYNLALNGTGLAVLASAEPSVDMTQLPDLQMLFGSLDYCQCSDCRSVLSPAAYLVDLLQFLKQFPAGNGFSNARDALLGRRPDLQYIALGCQNTNVTLPYIDVVNELLEAAIVPPSPAVTVYETTGTSAERRALPQQVSQPAYQKTVTAVFPLSLPFDENFARTSAYLEALGTSLEALMSLCGTGTAGARAAARLGLNPAMQAVVNSIDTSDPWKRWGFTSAHPTIDPTTGQPFNPAPTDWTAALSGVPLFMNRAEVDFAHLCQLLEVHWVTAGSVTLNLGTTTLPPPASVTVASCDTAAMTLSGLNSDVLDRANRFLRLLSATGLQMWELDWALATQGSSMDEAFLVFLADALALRGRLGLPLQEMLCFWGPMPTLDVTNHLGDADSVVPSTYARVFRSPTLLESWSTVFVDAGALSGGPITVPADPPPTPAQLGNLNAIKAALGLSADDIAAILAATGTANTLSIDTLNVLLRHARLASCLALSISDLLLWTVLTDAKPFGGAPADTAEFLRRLAFLQGTAVSPQDLDYLLRAGSPSESELTFTPARAKALLQTVRDAIAKCAPAAQADAATVATIFNSTLATATGAPANVVSAVLDQTGILPLAAATVAQLLAQTTGVDPAQFPQLIDAFTRVAKGVALFDALALRADEFVFLVLNARHFNWLDPSALPRSTPAASLFEPFERLIQAAQLNRRQGARSPKLFDVLGGWVTALPSDWTNAISANGGALALALGASVPDFTTLAKALGAMTPSLNAATQTGSLADVGMLTALANALDSATRFGIGTGTLLQLATAPPTDDSATAAMGVYQSKYDTGAWYGAVQPIEDGLREARRDALVAYVLGQGAAITVFPPMLSRDDIFNRFLIDPGMCACMLTTRLLEASLAIQQFVQQCYLGLVPEVLIDTTAHPAWNDWSWMKEFRLWQANRQVFLYPENYLLPELRTDKSPFFADLENDLKQGNCDADAANAAFENYLRKLVEVANLVVAAHYLQTRADGSRVLHVFARTRATPPKWYYRTREVTGLASGIWTPWQPLSLDIPAGQVMPVVWDQRLHLVWPIFKQIAERAADQPVPTSSAPPATVPTARKFWTVEFAMSELTAGQWQAKRTYTQKSFFGTDPSAPGSSLEPSLSFTFRAYEDSSFNLQLAVYYNDLNLVFGQDQPLSWQARNRLVGTGTLPSPDSPLSVSESILLPDPAKIDPTQEPSIAQVTALWQTDSLPQPASYRYSGQDLVWFNTNFRVVWRGSRLPNPVGQVALNALSQTFWGIPTSIELLGTIANPSMVVPHHHPQSGQDIADPLFVAEPSRTYLVSPRNPPIIFPGPMPVSTGGVNVAARIAPRTATYTFEPFYHPFARTCLRELEIGGIDRMMERGLQIDPQGVRGQGTYDFQSLYNPQPPVTQPYPIEDLDFSVNGAYALYNWEIFYHAPMFVAAQLMRNQQYQAAMQWLEYVFNPTDPDSGPVPGHFWRTLPFYQMNASDWLAQQIQNILTTLAADAQQGISDPDTAAAILDWMAHPFDPHRVARLRIGAYAKATVMKFLDNLIAWGDSLYAQYTMERVAQAEQLYVFANLILGPRPEQVRLRDTDLATRPDATTYAMIGTQWDPFSDTLVAIENLIAAPTPPQQAADAPVLPQISTLFFCIPPNAQLLAYWDTVSDRLYKIRHCLNLQGVAQPLPLYAPPINPLQLVEQAASGPGGVGALTFTPVYRFAVYLERALEVTNDVRAYGALVLAALEKKDAEALAALRANQDVDIQTRLLDSKTQAVTEAQQQITALQNQKAAVQIRYDFYANIAFMNDWETTALGLQSRALISSGLAVILDLTAAATYPLPQATAGGAGFGGSPTFTITEGGQQAGNTATAVASQLREVAGILSTSSGLAATMGGYQRRQDDWTLQKNLAAAELTQLDSQIAAATERLNIANNEVALQQRQISNAQAVSDFLTNKYTSAQLYDWMLTQLTTTHTQAYQLAFSLAQQAEATYRYELGTQDNFLQFGYWDSQHKGLSAGESLLFDLRRMQAQYLAANSRELELVKHISLALTQPMALVQLLQTGTCRIALDEALFDLDHPGNYFRRLRSTAISVFCVTGPYTCVNATLVLDSATVRVTPPIAPYTPASAASPPASPSFVTSPAPATATIVTSHGQNDAGLFDVNLRDERWLPFEGQGAISTWTLTLDPRDNSFDLSTITDVILHVRYTARSAGGNAEAVRQGLKQHVGDRQVMLSAKSCFSNAYYAFFQPSDTAASQQSLLLPLAANVLPFSNLGAPAITAIATYFPLKQVPPTGTTIAATFGPVGGTANPISITQVPGSTGGGIPIAALGADAGLTGPSPPGSYALTIPESSVPPALGITSNGHLRLDADRFQDIVLVISYTVT